MWHDACSEEKETDNFCWFYCQGLIQTPFLSLVTLISNRWTWMFLFASITTLLWMIVVFLVFFSALCCCWLKQKKIRIDAKKTKFFTSIRRFCFSFLSVKFILSVLLFHIFAYFTVSSYFSFSNVEEKKMKLLNLSNAYRLI